jgi:hypothetical protein
LVDPRIDGSDAARPARHFIPETLFDHRSPKG